MSTSHETSQYTTASFHLSSHCTRWLFPDLPLLSRHQIQNIKNNAPVDSNYSVSENGTPSLNHSACTPAEFLELFQKYHVTHKLDESSFLTWLQEMTLVHDSITKMVRLMEGYDNANPVPKFLPRVRSTAILYFRRFFHKRSVMEWNMTHILVACMFLAAKTEEMHLDIQHFETRLEQLTGSKQLTRQVILPAELVLLDGLDFDLQVLHPYRSMVAFVYGVWGVDGVDTTTASSTFLPRINDKARHTLEQMLINTNVALIFTPGVIALGVVYAALEQLDLTPEQFEHHKRLLDAYVQQQFQSQSHCDQLMLQIDRVRQCALDIPSVDAGEVKQITKKLKRVLKVVNAYKVQEEAHIKEQLRKEEQEKERRKDQDMLEHIEETQRFLTKENDNKKRGGLF